MADFMSVHDPKDNEKLDGLGKEGRERNEALIMCLNKRTSSY